ncbi:hypothetical protein Gohar_007232 [Gossypium harknessii]|uniref:Uncharacterized protein n=1 Tax=Gossypium harknessii TaxID=34285 RepID=A0A7J9GH77_9ROSI|nr:hypothetical protein [Gossypium harknessii]
MVVEQKSCQLQRDLRNRRERDTEKEILRSRFLALKGLENLEIRKDEMDYMILVGEGEKLKANGKMAAQISIKSKEGFKSGIAGNCGDSNIDVGSGILEAGSRKNKGNYQPKQG